MKETSGNTKLTIVESADETLAPSQQSECLSECRTDWSDWVPDIRATLMFVTRGDEVLLIHKLTGIGEGKVNGPGGKIDPGETAEQAIIRECQEELHITTLNPIKMGELCFAMSDIPDIHCHVYVTEEFEGTPTATVEADPFWCKISDIPYEKMWDDDQFWLPQMLAGNKVFGRFSFECEDILWKEIFIGDAAVQGWLGE